MQEFDASMEVRVEEPEYLSLEDVVQKTQAKAEKSSYPWYRVRKMAREIVVGGEVKTHLCIECTTIICINYSITVLLSYAVCFRFSVCVLVVVLFVNHVVLRILLLLDQEVRETKLSPFNLQPFRTYQRPLDTQFRSPCTT